MNRRLALGVLAVGLLATSAGCTGLFGGGSISEEQLDEDPPLEGYDWNESADVHIRVTPGAKFQAVYDVSTAQAQDGTLELFRRDGFGGRNPLDVSAVRYRYPNGTVITGTELLERGGEVDRSRSAVTVTLPPNATGEGKLAFTAGGTPKRFSLPTYVSGEGVSYEVVLPEDRRVSFFLFGGVTPGADSTRVDDRGRLHVEWQSVTSNTVVVRYYLARDLTLFAGALVVLGVVAGGGLLYYQRQIQQLQERREEMGLDVDTDDDDFGKNPPPGMG